MSNRWSKPRTGELFSAPERNITLEARWIYRAVLALRRKGYNVWRRGFNRHYVPFLRREVGSLELAKLARRLKKRETDDRDGTAEAGTVSLHTGRSAVEISHMERDQPTQISFTLLRPNVP